MKHASFVQYLVKGFLALLVTLTLTACGGGGGGDADDPVKLTLGTLIVSNLNPQVGQTVKLSVLVVPGDAGVSAVTLTITPPGGVPVQRAMVREETRERAETTETYVYDWQVDQVGSHQFKVTATDGTEVVATPVRTVVAQPASSGDGDVCGMVTAVIPM